MNKKSEIQILGWIGVVLILLAYTLLNFDVVTNKSVVYLIANLLGSILIIIEAFSKKDYQPVFLNIVWALVALIGFLSLIF
jgi:hypothetical protein